MKKTKKHFGEFNIKLPQTQLFALKLLAAKFNMDISQIITVALDDYYRKKLTGREKDFLCDEISANQIIGETINNNRGIWGYSKDSNDIPDSKKHMLIEA